MHKNIFVAFLLFVLSTIILNAMEPCIPCDPAPQSQQNYARNVQTVDCYKVPLELQQEILLYVIINSNIHKTFRLTEVCKSWFCWIHGISLSFTNESFKSPSDFMNRAQELQNSNNQNNKLIDHILQALRKKTAQENNKFTWLKVNDHQKARNLFANLLHTSTLSKTDRILYKISFGTFHEKPLFPMFSAKPHNRSISRPQAALFTIPFLEPNYQDDFGNTVLHRAVQYNHITMVKELIKNGADVNVLNKDNVTPLLAASHYGTNEIAELLLNNNADINKAHELGMTPLYQASYKGHTAIVELLLKKNNADINKADNDGWTPLYVASCNGHIKIVKLLLENNANINKANKSGRTPLLAVSFFGHKEIAELLIVHGANVNQADRHGWKPLSAAFYGCHTQTAALLVESGAQKGEPYMDHCSIS